VNSPGGSALASEEIWREVYLTNKVKKVIVSMGDYAASGGYYISAPAHKIFADPMTITGSIGVFGLLPYTGKMFENKLGIQFDYVSTNEHSILSINRKLSDEEQKIIQQEVSNIYDLFLKRVSQGRGLSIDSVNTIGRGRVWTGSDAKKIGLIDEIGGMNDALTYAKKFVKEEPMILYYPKVKKNKVEQLLRLFEDEDAMVSSQSTSIMQNTYLLEIHKKMKLMEQYVGIQMRLPYEISIE
jgi:protease-4